jgi:hypothetical protein
MSSLAVEVTLERNDGSTEARELALKPAELAPRQQGLYEFEYDGKLYTGYTVTKLSSDSGEVKFNAPSSKQQTASSAQ